MTPRERFFRQRAGGQARAEVCLGRQGSELEQKKQPQPKKPKKKKRTALVVSRDRKQFWTTQAQFWQWVREGVVVKTGDRPLAGKFVREHEDLLVVLSNTVLNPAHPNHLREALLSRRVGLAAR